MGLQIPQTYSLLILNYKDTLKLNANGQHRGHYRTEHFQIGLKKPRISWTFESSP